MPSKLSNNERKFVPPAMWLELNEAELNRLKLGFIRLKGNTPKRLRRSSWIEWRLRDLKVRELIGAPK